MFTVFQNFDVKTPKWSKVGRPLKGAYIFFPIKTSGRLLEAWLVLTRSMENCKFLWKLTLVSGNRAWIY